MVRLIYVHIFGTQCLNPELSIQTRSIIVYVLSYMQTHKYAYIYIYLYIWYPPPPKPTCLVTLLVFGVDLWRNFNPISLCLLATPGSGSMNYRIRD